MTCGRDCQCLKCRYARRARGDHRATTVRVAHAGPTTTTPAPASPARADHDVVGATVAIAARMRHG